MGMAGAGNGVERTALGYVDQPKAIKMHVDSEDKLTRQIVVSGQMRNVTFINENGLYALILSSKLPQAKTLDAAYSIAFPNSTPINVNKKKD